MAIAITFDPKIDAGAVLTVITILGGILGILAWTIREWRARRSSAMQRARDGALRLLLAILRRADRPMTFDQLEAAFAAPELENARRQYCNRDFAFANRTELEAAIYRLDWEGKVDFVDSDTIAFGVDRVASQSDWQRPFPIKTERLLNELSEALAEAKSEQDYGWGTPLARLARLAVQVAPEQASALLRRHIETVAGDPAHGRQAILLLEAASSNWMPPTP